MKLLIITLSIFAGTALTTQAQTKMAVAEETNLGPAKYTEIEPFSYTKDTRSKKMLVQTNAKRIDPALVDEQPAIANDGKQRIEGRLAENTAVATPVVQKE